MVIRCEDITKGYARLPAIHVYSAMAERIDFSQVQHRVIETDLNKYNIKIEENHGLNERTGFWWLVFTFNFALEKGIKVRLTNFKYIESTKLTMEIVRCVYLGIKSDEKVDSLDIEEKLANPGKLYQINDSVGWPEKLRKYLEENIVPLVIKKIRYTKYSPQFSFFLSNKSKDKPLMETFRNGLKFLGYKTWLDIDDMPMAANLQGALTVAIEKCDCFLVWLNREYFQDNYCKAELLYANQLGKVILAFGDYEEIKDLLRGAFEFLANRPIYDASKSSFLEVLRRIDEAFFEFENLPI